MKRQMQDVVHYMRKLTLYKQVKGTEKGGREGEKHHSKDLML